ncbi:MAG: aminotransferase class I/II-fold pyridoxal phosphate-dependent enzyme, partial [Parvularculaceae bacterium]|nr:aminotransferase class I/II-fold pyridoxal phosphate-dependent enzyme [Parvularculaceae bacterium]
MRPLNPVFAKRPVTIFQVMTALARQHDAINLGQGFPDEDGPQDVRAIAARAILEEQNQYAPVAGTPELRAAVARQNRRFFGLDFDPDREVLVTAGATEGLASAFLALLSPGDEAVLVAPFYDSYLPMVEAAGAEAVVIPLSPPDWRLSAERLAAAISPRTKLIAINTPHNPIAKVWRREELEIIAEACVRNDLVAVSDEVYEHLVFDGAKHVTLSDIPGMRERTLRIGSAGKTFSMTGWRIGYMSGPASLIEGVMKAHQFVAYTSPPHLQKAVAAGLDFPDTYYRNFVADMQTKRDLMRAALEGAGLATLPCEGTYF